MSVPPGVVRAVLGAGVVVGVVLIGGALGYLPAAVLHVLAASSVIDAGENTGYELFTQVAFAGAFVGLMAGGVLGSLLGDRPRRSGIGRLTPAKGPWPADLFRCRH